MQPEKPFNRLEQLAYKGDKFILNQALKFDYNRPCIRFGSLKPSQYLVMSSAPGIMSMIDGISEGRLMEADKPDFTERMVPQTQRQLNEILFDGCTSYEDLLQKTKHDLIGYGKIFYRRPLDSFHAWGFQETYDFRFNTENVLQVMNFIADVNKGKKRRTGEESFSHELRIMRRTLRRVNEHMRLFNEGLDYFPYTPTGVELLCLSVLLHDFVEKEKGISPGGYEYRNIRGGVKNESMLRIFQNNQDGSRGESIDIPMDSTDFQFLDRALAELDSGEAKLEPGVHTLVERVRTKERITTVVTKQRMMQEISQEVKLEDRFDNMMTYPFILIPDREPCVVGSYMPNDPEKIRRKAMETIMNFTYLENSGVWHRSPPHNGERLYRGTIGRIANGVLSCMYSPGCDQPHLKTIQPCVAAVKLLVGVAGHGLSEEIKKQKVVTFF